MIIVYSVHQEEIPVWNSIASAFKLNPGQIVSENKIYDLLLFNHWIYSYKVCMNKIYNKVHQD